jgi:hypothetical protein
MLSQQSSKSDKTNDTANEVTKGGHESNLLHATLV